MLLTFINNILLYHYKEKELLTKNTYVIVSFKENTRTVNKGLLGNEAKYSVPCILINIADPFCQQNS